MQFMKYIDEEVKLQTLHICSTMRLLPNPLTCLLNCISGPYLIFVIFFTQAKFLENKIYTEKTRKLRQIRVKSVKIYTGQKKFTREFSWLS